MKREWGSIVLVTGLTLTLSVASGWAGPPNPTQSDDFGNTAGGTNALLHTPGLVGSSDRIDGHDNTPSETKRSGATGRAMAIPPLALARSLLT
jgi:hypothetical protein